MALKGKLNLENLASDPGSPVAGQMYFNTTNNVLKYYDGSAWIEAAAGGGQAGIIPATNLYMWLDAANTDSYAGGGANVWYDLGKNAYNWNVDSASFVGTGIKHFNFGNGYRATRSSLNDVPMGAEVTIVAFTRVITSTSTFRTFTRGANNDHQIIINSGQDAVGAYDNDNNGLFLSSGFNVTSLSNYNTLFNGWFLRMSQSTSPHWRLSFNNDTSDSATIADSRAASNNGFCVIGGYHNNTAATYVAPGSGAQSWGDFAVFLYYNRILSYEEQAAIYYYYKNTFGI